MNLETELLEITNNNLSEAQFMASNFLDLSVQNRVFFNVIGAESVISYLGKLGVDIENISSIHSIKRVIEKLDIADVILENIHIDARVVFNGNELFIPKSHYKMGIVPDIYAFLKYDNSFQRINFIGFIKSSEIDLNNSNDKYYFADPDKLHSPFDMFDFINNFSKDVKNLTDGQILRGRELSVAVADHDVTDNEFNEFLGLLVKSNVLRNSVLEYDNFETLASRVARALQVSKAEKEKEDAVVDFDDFMNIDNEMNDENSQDAQHEEDSEKQEYQDLNGDDLLDEVTDNILDITQTAATVAGIAGAANAIGTSAVSKEAIDLAGMAGEVIADEAEKLLSDDLTPSEDFTGNINSDTREIPEDFTDEAQIEEFTDATENGQEETSVAQDVIEEEVIDTTSQEIQTEQEVEQDASFEDSFDENNLEDLPDIDSSESDLPAVDIDENEQSDISEQTDVLEDNNSSMPPDDESKVEETDSVEGGTDAFSEDSSKDEEFSNFDNMEMNEDLNFDDLEMDDFQLSEDLISEEPSEQEEADVDALNESEPGITEEPESVSEEAIPIEDSFDEENIVQNETFSDADGSDIAEAGSDGNKDGSDLSSFETKDTDEFTDLFDENADLNFEDLSGVTENEIAEDFELTEAPEGIENSENPENIDVEVQTEEPQENITDISGTDEISGTDTESEAPSVWDGEFTDVIEQDPEVGDDDLILSSNSNQNKNDSAEFDADIETFSISDTSLDEFNTSDNSFAYVDDSDNVDNLSAFDELSAQNTDEQKNEKEIDLFSFSDLTDEPTLAPDNAEVSFSDIDELSDFESIAPIEDSSNVDYFADNSETLDLTPTKSVKENSVTISDKTLVPGEIFIDINKDSSKAGIPTSNEHLEELYNNNNFISDDNGLNNEVIIGNEKGKQIPLVAGIGGIALVVVIAGIILLSVSKFMNPSQNEPEPVVTDNAPQSNNLGEDVPNMNVDNNNVVMNNNETQGSVPQSAVPAGQNNTKQVTNPQVAQPQVQQISKPIPATSFLSVRKLSWEVPDYISADSNFRQYFQSTGKSLKAGLSSDLLLATDYTYSDQIRVSILFGKDGTFQQAKILLSSGSSQVDNIVLQSVNQTLKVLKAPNSLGNDQSTTVILKIYL